MNGEERRKQILKTLQSSQKPVSGSSFSKQLAVSRQVIVQDIALLRANGCDIVSTTSGYLLYHAPKQTKRVVKIFHTEDAAETELNLIVDHGGIVEDVFIYHKAYGVVRAELHIQNRLDVQKYLQKIREGKSTFLMKATSGYHYHTILAQDEKTLDLIFTALGDAGFLAPLQDYEPIDFWNVSDCSSN